jgi:hypothetical protein
VHLMKVAFGRPFCSDIGSSTISFLIHLLLVVYHRLYPAHSEQYGFVNGLFFLVVFHCKETM